MADRSDELAKARKRSRKWREENPEKLREQGRRRRARGGENARILQWANANRIKRRRTGWRFQGIDPDAAEQALRQHDGACDLCGDTKPGGRWNSWCVDHDHKENRVRGVLCTRCNRGLGLVDRVDLERIESYLQRGSARTAMKTEVDPLAITTGGNP